MCIRTAHKLSQKKKSIYPKALLNFSALKQSSLSLTKMLNYSYVIRKGYIAPTEYLNPLIISKSTDRVKYRPL